MPILREDVSQYMFLYNELKDTIEKDRGYFPNKITQGHYAELLKRQINIYQEEKGRRMTKEEIRDSIVEGTPGYLAPDTEYQGEGVAMKQHDARLLNLPQDKQKLLDKRKLYEYQVQNPGKFRARTVATAMRKLSAIQKFDANPGLTTEEFFERGYDIDVYLEFEQSKYIGTFDEETEAFYYVPEEIAKNYLMDMRWTSGKGGGGSNRTPGYERRFDATIWMTRVKKELGID